ncbi:MAG TPA: lipopolysaccharide biosynthesis protein [Candidatus Polarisedimenticolia bacterium]|jgi:O-antigen/teichoic acid export membrane protein|nr:lipopolysaccharide biosynthesis protein [Candidatus Polarisedimenticolia bacterium]
MERTGRPDARGLDAHGEKTAAARGVAWGGIESATSALVGLVLTPFVVRACGIEGLGLWGASWSLAHTTHLLDLGVGASYSRFTSKAIAISDTAGLNRILGAGMGFHLGLGILLSAIALVCGPRALGLVVPGGPLAGQAATVFGCTLATVVLRTVLSGYRGVVAGAQRLDRLGRIGSTVSLLEGCGAALALSGGFGLRGMALNSLLAAGLASFLEATAAHRLVPGLRPVPFAAGRAEWRELLSFGMRIQIVRVSEILGAHLPRLLLAGASGFVAAGLYDLGAKIAGILQIAALPLPVIQPLAGRLDARGDDQSVRALVERATRYVALLAVPCLALVLLDAEAVLRAWTGRDIPQASATAARLLAAAAALSFMVSPLRLVLRGMGRPGPEARAALGGSLVHVGLAAGLAAPYGAPGVAAAALLGAALAAALLTRGALRIAPRLVRPTGLAVPAPVLAGLGGLLAGGALRLAVLGAHLPVATRTAALTRLLPEGIVLVSAAFLLAVWLRAFTRDDLAALAGALPGAGRAAGPRASGPAGPHAALGAAGRT